MSKRLEKLRQSDRKLLVPFVTAGDLSADQTLTLMHALVNAGADVIELGVPFSDPVADGPVIQRSSERALLRGMTLKGVLELVRGFRQDDGVTPIVLMGYANPIERFGWPAFFQAAAASGVDGILVVDYPPEAMTQWKAHLTETGISPIFLVAPTTEPDRVEKIAGVGSGFIYYISLAGVTGSDQIDLDAMGAQIDALKQKTDLPIVAGFGIKDEKTAAAVAARADGVVIGSRIIELIEASEDGTDVDLALQWLAEVRKTIDGLGR